MVRILNRQDDDQYRYLQHLGRGGFGTVSKMCRATDGQIVACKKIESRHNPQLVQLLSREMNTWESVSKESHIVPFLECAVTPSTGTVRFYMKYYGGGDLQHFLDSFHGQGKRLQPIIAMLISRAIATGVAACHAHNILHRDIKPQNVLLASTIRAECLLNGTEKDIESMIRSLVASKGVCLSDFGLGKFVGNQMMASIGAQVGTPGYTAPETAYGIYTRSADIYSLGALMYCICQGQPPSGGQTTISSLYPASFRSLVSQCLSNDHTRRPSAIDVATRTLISITTEVMSRASPPQNPLEQTRPSPKRVNNQVVQMNPAPIACYQQPQQLVPQYAVPVAIQQPRIFVQPQPQPQFNAQIQQLMNQMQAEFNKMLVTLNIAYPHNQPHN